MVSEFYDIYSIIRRSPFVKGMTMHLEEIDKAPLKRYVEELFPALVRASGYSAKTMCGHFLAMTAQVLREQYAYNQNGSKDEAVKTDIYEKLEEMDQLYLNGLTLALIFWPNHWRMLRYYEDTFLPMPFPKTGSCLDLGCGHGLFSCRFGSFYPEWYIVSVDISSFAVQRTDRLWNEFRLPKKRLRTLRMEVIDFLESNTQRYNVILFSELIEHMQNGREVLTKLKEHLAQDGCIFFTTALNSYFVDHQIYFNTVDEIKDIIHESGLVAIDFMVEKVAETPHGLQADIFSILVRPDSKWMNMASHLGTVETLHHIGVLTMDIEISIKKWINRNASLVLGPVTDLGLDCKVAFLKIPGMANFLELVQPYSESSSINRRIHSNRMDHFCFQVENILDAISNREKKGARLVFGPKVAAVFRRNVAFMLDSEGLLTELVEIDSSHSWFI